MVLSWDNITGAHTNTHTPALFPHPPHLHQVALSLLKTLPPSVDSVTMTTHSLSGSHGLAGKKKKKTVLFASILLLYYCIVSYYWTWSFSFGQASPDKQKRAGWTKQTLKCRSINSDHVMHKIRCKIRSNSCFVITQLNLDHYKNGHLVSFNILSDLQQAFWI